MPAHSMHVEIPLGLWRELSEVQGEGRAKNKEFGTAYLNYAESEGVCKIKMETS